MVEESEPGHGDVSEQKQDPWSPPLCDALLCVCDAFAAEIDCVE